jgi:hypothetical protein
VESKKSALQLAPFGVLYSAIATVVGLAVLYYGVIYQNGTHFSYFAYAGLLVIALMQCVVALPKSDFSRARYFASIAGMMFLAVAIYAGIEIYVNTRMEGLVADTLDVVTLSSPIFVVSAVSLVIFGVGFHLAGKLYHPTDAFSKRLYVRLWNGHYFGQKSSKVLSAVWPVQS